MNTEVVTMRNMSPAADRKQRFHVLFHETGGDPSDLLSLLALAVERRDWEETGISFTEYIERPYDEGIGWRVEDLRTVLQLKHRHEIPPKIDPEIVARMQWLRETVTDLLNPAAPKHGEIGNGRDGQSRGDIIPSTSSRGTSSAHALRRLKRDRPDLAQRVLKGEISAHKAAKEAGFRRPTLTAPADPEDLARYLKRRFTPEELSLLLNALRQP